MPVFIQKHNELKLQEQGQSADSDDPYNKTIDMLGTIKLPNNMRLIQNNLPMSQYESDKPKREKKKIDLQNLNMQYIAEEVEVEEPTSN